MKVAIEALVHEGQAMGMGRYARLLLEGLQRFGGDFQFYLFDYLSRDYRNRIERLWLPEGPNFEHRFRWLPRPVMPLLEERLGIRVQERWLRKAGVDLFHGIRGILPPLSGRIRKLLTVHDLQFKINPEWFQDEWYRRFDKSVAEADFMIVASGNSKSELQEFCGVPAEKIGVIPHGLDPGFRIVEEPGVLNATRSKYELPENYILFVGGLRPLKNLMRLVDACAAVVKQFPDVELVLVGASVSGQDALDERIRQSGIGERVRFTGYVSQDELVHLYNMATVFAFPSLHEGFGYPVLEAMACGCPVLASRVASLPEVCGDAAEFVDPQDVDSIAQGLTNLLSSEARRSELRASGRERVQQYDWQTNIERHLYVYRQIIAGEPVTLG